MLGTLLPHQKQVKIVGAGITGLLAAYILKQKGFEVQLLEAGDRPGGLIQTLQAEHGLVETAAHSLLVNPEMEVFFKELGVELAPVNPQSKARYIYRNQKMRRMPLTVKEIFYTLFRFFSSPKHVLDFQRASLAEWGTTYLGVPATRYLLSPFITGIFACKPDELNAKLAFPKLIPSDPTLSLFRFFRSKKKSARPKMMAPVKGMQFVIDTLQSKLKEELILNTPVYSLPTDENLILCVPTAQLSKLIATEDAESAQYLLLVRYAPLISVTCFYAKSAFAKEPKGVGVLIPRGEGIRALGCLFNSSSFPTRTLSENVLSFTIMFGGTSDPDVLKLSDTELNDLIDREIRVLLGAFAKPLSTHINRWNRAIPVYSNELKKARESLLARWCRAPGKMVFSNYSREVSIRSILDAMLHL